MRRVLDQDAQRERRRQMLILDRIAASAERQLIKELSNTSNQLIQVFDLTGNVPHSIGEHQQRIEAILKQFWSLSINALAGRVADAAVAKGRVVNRKNDQDRFELFVFEYLQQFGGLKIVQISETTRTQIVDQIEAGRKEGLGQREIAKNMLANVSGLAKARANVIARTETHSAGNFGALKQAEDSGLEMMREWIASSGARTRDSHRQADGQIVGLNDPFTVGGHKLMYPGDPSGPGSETINCRCAVGYVVAD